jgi:hypothetical protein
VRSIRGSTFWLAVIMVLIAAAGWLWLASHPPLA